MGADASSTQFPREIDSKKPISETIFTVLDIEATGGNPTAEKIIEVAMFQVRDGRILDFYHVLINPQKKIPLFISALTGITDEMLADKPTFQEVGEELLSFIGDSVLVAHNAQFDIGFLRAECGNNHFATLQNGSICTRKLSRRVFPWLPGFNLDTVARFLGIDIRDRHRAYGDALATCAILNTSIDYLAQCGINYLGELYSLAGGKINLP